jgi:hypothetical protein
MDFGEWDGELDKEDTLMTVDLMQKPSKKRSLAAGKNHKAVLKCPYL